MPHDHQQAKQSPTAINMGPSLKLQFPNLYISTLAANFSKKHFHVMILFSIILHSIFYYPKKLSDQD